MTTRLNGAPLDGAPYRIRLFEDALPQLSETLEWASTAPGFKRHKKDFFDQWELGASSVDPDRLLPWMRDMAGLSDWVTRMGVVFDERFLPVVRITFHRLTEGQGIGVHTDDSRPGFETHRLVVTLDNHWADAWGGHFYVLRSDSPEDVHTIFRPTPNFGIAFEMSPTSFHAVGEVSQAVRHSVVLSFWAERSLGDAGARATFQELTRDAFFLD